MMFVEALNSLNDSAPMAGSPASSSSERMPKATVEAELPFFKPNYQFRRVATLWVSFQALNQVGPVNLLPSLAKATSRTTRVSFNLCGR